MTKNVIAPLVLAGVLVFGLTVGSMAQGNQYRIGESTTSSASVDNGPVRMARVSYVTGDILFRPAAGASWSPASVNMPLRQGAQIWVSKGRAELQFDDGSYMRLGNGAVVTLPTLYSDSQGEFTEIKMNEGLATLKLRDAQSIYQVDTPYAAVISHGPSYYRMGIDNGFVVAVHSGDVAVQGSNGKKTLGSGDYLYMASTGSPYEIARVPHEDSWDHWNYARDEQLSDPHSVHYLPPDISMVAGNLDSYGSWHVAAKYGPVWTPTVYDPTWRPYYHGHWVWVEPYGWTWVSSEPWGWAPYHYGTWIHLGFGWSWVPGPAVQYWSPAVVSFSDYNGDIAWAPLCPTEVRYPSALSFGIGFGGSNWSLFFSIGGCAEYYPAGPFFCAPRPWPNYFCNRTVIVNNFYGGGFNTYNRFYPRFDPYNARFAHGVTMASASAFGGVGRYAPVPPGGTDPFLHGRPVGAPPVGRLPMSGPSGIRASRVAFTPTRSFSAPPAQVNRFLSRPVFRAPLPTQVARVAPPIPNAQRARQAMLRPAPMRAAANNSPQGLRRTAVGSPIPNAAANHARMVASAARRSLGMPSGQVGQHNNAQFHRGNSNTVAANNQHARNMNQAAMQAQHARNLSHVAAQGHENGAGRPERRQAYAFSTPAHVRTSPAHFASQQRAFRQHPFTAPVRSPIRGGGPSTGFRISRNFGPEPMPSQHGYQFGESSPRGGGGFVPSGHAAQPVHQMPAAHGGGGGQGRQRDGR